jgi:hypothetical protein
VRNCRRVLNGSNCENVRRRNHDELRRTAGASEPAREFLPRASMIRSREQASAIA